MSWQRALTNRLVQGWQRRGPLAWLLWPLSLLYGLVVRLRLALYRSGRLRVERVRVPVIVVGNVIAGGGGKTPTVIALVEHFLARSLQPGVISRGYGRTSQGVREVLPGRPAAESGDEPLLIRQRTGAPVFVGERRIEAARALLKAYPRTNVIVCDDGLQHLELARDISICVFDDRGVGNGFLLPAGPLREPWPRPVHLVLHTGQRPTFAGYAAKRKLAAEAVRKDGSRVELAALVKLSNYAPLMAVAGTAQPQTFFDMLEAAGLPLAHTEARPDHDDYADWQPPSDRDYTILCTEKDAPKLWVHHPNALAVPLVFEPEAPFLVAVDNLLSDAFSAKLSSAYLSDEDDA